MSFDEVVISVKRLSKRYEIYATPRDRLKQLLLPKLHAMLPLAGNRHARSGSALPQYFLELWGLRDVSFHVPRGDALSVVGLSRSGKSTLLELAQTTGSGVAQ